MRQIFISIPFYTYYFLRDFRFPFSVFHFYFSLCPFHFSLYVILTDSVPARPTYIDVVFEPGGTSPPHPFIPLSISMARGKMQCHDAYAADPPGSPWHRHSSLNAVGTLRILTEDYRTCMYSRVHVVVFLVGSEFRWGGLCTSRIDPKIYTAWSASCWRFLSCKNWQFKKYFVINFSIDYQQNQITRRICSSEKR